MLILDYQKKFHKSVIHSCVKALLAGKVIAYPTDTSYGLAADANNIKAINRLYKIKGRDFNKPVHIIVPSVSAAKKIVKWNLQASKLSKAFWPGALTLVLELKAKSLGLSKLSAKTGYIGIRMPKNKIALDLSQQLKCPVTATSANRSGQKDCYSASEIMEQFKNEKNKPDIILNSDMLPKKKPSTLLKINSNGQTEVLRKGPVSFNKIKAALK